MHRATNVSYSVGQQVSSLSHDPRTLPPRTAYQQHRLLSEGPKAGLHRVSRTDVDLLIRTSNLYEFLNKTLITQGNPFRGSKLKRAATTLHNKSGACNILSFEREWQRPVIL
jgi:hypothetical protein